MIREHWEKCVNIVSPTPHAACARFVNRLMNLLAVVKIFTTMSHFVHYVIYALLVIFCLNSCRMGPNQSSHHRWHLGRIFIHSWAASFGRFSIWHTRLAMATTLCLCSVFYILSLFLVSNMRHKDICVLYINIF